MKKSLVFLYALGFLFGLVGTASAILFSDTKSSDVKHAGGPVAGLIFPTSYSYSNDTPDDFGVPPDEVNSATLTVSGYWIDGNDNGVEIAGIATGYLNEGGSQVNRWLWNWDTPSVIFSDIKNIFDSNWNVGDSLDVTISAIGSWGDWKLELASATFTPDYTDTSVPFSEPANMLLFGFGLIGLASFGRKKFSRKVQGSERLSLSHG